MVAILKATEGATEFERQNAVVVALRGGDANVSCPSSNAWIRCKVWQFRHADGAVLERWTGFVIVHVAHVETIDEVIFGQPGDLVLLGARTLEGLNFRVEPVSNRLIDVGPAPAAVVADGTSSPPDWSRQET